MGNATNDWTCKTRPWKSSFRSSLDTAREITWDFLTFNFHGILARPLFFAVCFLIGTTIAFYGVLKSVQQLLEIPLSKLQRTTIRKMNGARTYAKYKKYALLLDKLQDRENWKNQKTDDPNFFDESQFLEDTKKLRAARERKNFVELILQLENTLLSQQFSLHGSGTSLGEHMYSFTYAGTKKIIEDCVKEVILALDATKQLCLQQNIPAPKVIEAADNLLRSLSTSHWGQMAPLVLSGGGAWAWHHYGVGDALIKENLLPNLICGCSGGAGVGAFLATRTDPELQSQSDPTYLSEIFKAFDQNTWAGSIKGIVRNGHFMNMDFWYKSSQNCFGTLTFLEGFKRTGRVLVISVSRADRVGAPYLLDYRSAPNVLISSAVIASCCFPLSGHPLHLKEKDKNGNIVDSEKFKSKYFHDGSLAGDVPISTLKEKWGEMHIICSQTNPHVFPFISNKLRGEAGRPVSTPFERLRRSLGIYRKDEHSLQWRSGYVMAIVEVVTKEILCFLLRVLAVLDLSPTIRGINWGVMANQTYTGDITLRPTRIYWNHRHLLSDPEPEKAEWYMQIGRRMVWTKFSLLETRWNIDRHLQDLYLSLHNPHLLHFSKNSKIKLSSNCMSCVEAAALRRIFSWRHHTIKTSHDNIDQNSDGCPSCEANKRMLYNLGT
eukprot:GHVP01037160.1.p1 GENE.GHVP01037160.1~~GHVP01037160.1.p1  ORF type:complete len:662 (-),score=88.87 GHVP01037160.1:3088-5073(-)